MTKQKIFIILIITFIAFIGQSGFYQGKVEACCGIWGMSVDAEPQIICLGQSTTISGYIGLYSIYTIPYLTWQLTISGPSSATYTQTGNQIISVTYTPPVAGEYTYTLYAWETRYGTSRTIQKKFYAVDIVAVLVDKEVACVNEAFTFTVTTNPTGYEYLIQWSGGEDPATGTGASFTTKFSTPGEKIVTASCGGSTVSKTVTVLPETSNCVSVDVSRTIEGPLNFVKNILKKVPGVKDVETSISGEVEKCDCCYLGTIIEKGEVSGNFSGSVTGKGDKPLVGIPPIHIQLKSPFPPPWDYRAIITGEADAKLTGKVSGNGGGSIKQECNAELCIEGSFGIGGTISVEAKGEAKICFKRPMEPGWCRGVTLIPASLSTGVTGECGLNTCGENNWKLCWDGLKYEVTISIKLGPWSEDVNWTFPILKPECWPKEE